MVIKVYIASSSGSTSVRFGVIACGLCAYEVIGGCICSSQAELFLFYLTDVHRAVILSLRGVA